VPRSEGKLEGGSPTRGVDDTVRVNRRQMSMVSGEREGHKNEATPPTAPTPPQPAPEPPIKEIRFVPIGGFGKGAAPMKPKRRDPLDQSAEFGDE